ncbi:MAG TPA: TIGR03564 family F420-dependent LLM class oxidoreductase [Iamia sp.]|jgi:F420-dependent oxidoreductase-like protein|nr:TIGR03564 family F420-dependent LLM class oxidoreductase [Iamia sp.]
MRIGIFGGDTAATGTIDDHVAAARAAAEDGFSSFWLPQIFGYDALTVLALIGREVPDIELGTAVVPTYPRHPAALAAQAVTTNEAADGRLVLGIGLSHGIVIEMMYGMSFEKPLRHMREYLAILLPLVQTGAADVEGETLTGRIGLSMVARRPFPVLIAALGPKMLALAGAVADGTVTWMTGPDTLRTHIVPSITSAAEEAGREAPRIIGALPVLVTDDEADGRARAGQAFAVYDTLPSYKAMLDREGAGGPADVALVGDEESVGQQLDAIVASGITDFVAVEYSRNPDESARTRALLRSRI